MKEKRATEKLNVEIAGIESTLAVIKGWVGDGDHQAHQLLDDALKRCESARDALLTIQFHSAQI